MELTKEVARGYIYTEFERGISAVRVHEQLVEAWGSDAPCRATVLRWYGDFKNNRRDSFKDGVKCGFAIN